MDGTGYGRAREDTLRAGGIARFHAERELPVRSCPGMALGKGEFAADRRHGAPLAHQQLEPRRLVANARPITKRAPAYGKSNFTTWGASVRGVTTT